MSIKGHVGASSLPFPGRSALTTVELLVAAALMSLILVLCLGLLGIVRGGATLGHAGGGRAQSLSLVLETVLRELRTSRKVVLPPLYPSAVSGRPEVAGFCYFVNAEMDCVMLHFRGGTLYRTVVSPSGDQSTGVIARGLGRVVFGPMPGAYPQMRVALAKDGAVLIGRASLLNTETPTWIGGEARAD